MLLGREEECARIDRLLADARLGRSGALVLRGEAGIGKTTLLDYAVGTAAQMQVLYACGIEPEMDLPFAGLHALLRPIVDLADAIPEVQAGALKAALALDSSAEADRLGTYAGTLSLLAEAAERLPMLVVVDDAHWLDRASAEALVFAARRMAGESILLLFAVRAGEGDFRAPGLQELPVRGLDREASFALLRERWRDVAPQVGRRLVEETGGNPLALIDVPGLLDERARSGEQPLPEPLPVSAGIALSVERTLSGLPRETREAALVAAAGDGRTGVDATAIEPAEDAGLVRVHEGVAVFRHPLVRAAVYRGASAAERRAAHRALADAYTSASDRDRRAWHLAAAATGADEAVASLLEGAADRAAERGGHAAQSRALERAAELSADDDKKADRLRAAARAAHWAGESGRALRLLEAAAPLVHDPLIRADVVHQQMGFAGFLGTRLSQEDVMREADAVAALDPDRWAKLVGLAVGLAQDRLDVTSALELAQRRAAIEGSLSPEWRERVRKDLAWSLVLAGRADEAQPLFADLGTRPHDAAGAVPPLAWVERFDEAREIGERSLGAYRAEGNVLGVIFDSTNLALVEAAAGRFAAARAAASEAAELAEQTGDVYLLGCNLPVLARLAAIGGREAEAVEHARRAIELAEKSGYEAIALEARWTLGLAELSAGRPDAAAAHIGPVMEALEERGVVEPSVVPAGGDHAEALIRSGADFERSLARLEEVAAAVGRRWALAAAARCRGLLAEDDDFDARFASAFELHDAGPSSPFERARTELLYGERLRRARRRVDARVHLRRAIELFDELGAAPWSEKARVELRATGERIPRRDPTAPEKLTPQELQIALQVAEGKSNREVAAALFLSPKTVEFHLTRVYRKLEVHSRAELVRLFAASPAPPAAVA